MRDDVNHPAKWERYYREGKAGWSLHTPTPVFQHLLAEEDAQGQRVFPPGRILIPGAGLGYDAREFARHGFAVVAVDFARDAVEAMQNALTPETAHAIVQADLFQLPAAWNETFDYVLEYTCFCALDPTRRDEYAAVIARLLKAGGKYIALAFPLGELVHPPEMTPGPPFPVNAPQLIALLQARGLVLRRREIHPATIKPRKGREELIVMQKQ